MTFSDSPAAHNLSGQSKEVGYGCPYCFRETDSQYLSESQKIVYMGRRRYILMKHPFQSMKDQFNGNSEKRHHAPHLTAHEVYEMVKDAHVILSKRKRTGKNTEEDDMWKKQSIFWELPYWKDLDIHHSIDMMHVKKNVCESLLLMTKFGKARKTRCSGFLFWTVRFRQFQNKTEEGAKLEDLKIQCGLK
jgi:hypothetical protein